MVKLIRWLIMARLMVTGRLWILMYIRLVQTDWEQEWLRVDGSLAKLQGLQRKNFEESLGLVTILLLSLISYLETTHSGQSSENNHQQQQQQGQHQRNQCNPIIYHSPPSSKAVVRSSGVSIYEPVIILQPFKLFIPHKLHINYIGISRLWTGLNPRSVLSPSSL